MIRCPICHKHFKSDLCPHSYVEAQERMKENKLRSMIRKEIERYMEEQNRGR